VVRSNREEIQRLIELSAREGNILPITSRCDTRCVFCSHRNNPPDIDVISIGVRTLDEIAQTMNCLDPRRPITIGESASSIIEGEPFTHPDFCKILTALRSRFPRTPVEITTNGHHLTSSMVDFLAGLGNVSLQISLNSASAKGRDLLMGDSAEQTERTLAGIGLIAGRGISYAASLVAMPHLTGWDDMLETVRFLAAHQATAIRVCMPGFARKALRPGVPDADTLHAQLREFIQGLPNDLACPVLIEPSYVTNLSAEISGVICDAPAWRAGLRRGHVIRRVNGREPRSRVEAWNMLAPRGPMSIAALKEGREEELFWINPHDGGSGIVMEYDFDMARADRIRQYILQRPGRTLLLASEFGYAVLRAVQELLHLSEDCAEVVMVKNLTFGGTIRAAGLLTVDDYEATFKDWQTRGKEKPCQILLPDESFNSLGFDLKHRHWSQLEALTQTPVKLA
jgi:hypothetical protein